MRNGCGPLPSEEASFLPAPLLPDIRIVAVISLKHYLFMLCSSTQSSNVILGASFTSTGLDILYHIQYLLDLNYGTQATWRLPQYAFNTLSVLKNSLFKSGKVSILRLF